MATVAEQLRQTSKGQLKYYTDWSPKDLKRDEFIPELCANVQVIFEIKSIKAVLEAIEDEAQVSWKNHQEEEARKSWIKRQSSPENLEDDFFYENQCKFCFTANTVEK